MLEMLNNTYDVDSQPRNEIVRGVLLYSDNHENVTNNADDHSENLVEMIEPQQQRILRQILKFWLLTRRNVGLYNYNTEILNLNM